jgi:hypothetical protein
MQMLAIITNGRRLYSLLLAGFGYVCTFAAATGAGPAVE